MINAFFFVIILWYDSAACIHHMGLYMAKQRRTALFAFVLLLFSVIFAMQQTFLTGCFILGNTRKQSS